MAIVIVSRSLKIAEATAELVRQTVGKDLAVAYAGGSPLSGHRVKASAVVAAIRNVWSDLGVAIFVDVGSTETDCEAAIKTMPRSCRRRIALCNAPLVEGTLMAALAAARGEDLASVRRTAERPYS